MLVSVRSDLGNDWLFLLGSSAALLDATTGEWMLRLCRFEGRGLSLNLALNSSIGLLLRDFSVVSLKVLTLVEFARVAVATGSAVLLSFCIGGEAGSAEHCGGQGNGEFHD